MKNRKKKNRKTAFALLVLIAVLAGAVSLPALRTPEPAAPAAQTAQNTELSAATEASAPSTEPSAATETSAQGTEQTAEAEQETETPPEEHRLIFVGDSRTIDLFADSDNSLEGVVHDDVLVYALHGAPFPYLESIVDVINVNNNDTLVTWMGANDSGDYAPYCALYGRLLEKGVRLIVCTVGPTGSDQAEVWYNEPYDNKYMQQFNTGLRSWAAANNVPVIDLYSYVERNVEIDMTDGVHYLPRPDPVLWGYILDKLKSYGAL